MWQLMAHSCLLATPHQGQTQTQHTAVPRKLAFWDRLKSQNKICKHHWTGSDYAMEATSWVRGSGEL
jgi:hypothetical protein